MAATADRIDRVSFRLMADLLGVTVEEYAARQVKSSPGQLGLWDDSATGGNLLRSSARQKSFDWDESKHPRAEDGKFAEAGAAGKSGGGATESPMKRPERRTYEEMKSEYREMKQKHPTHTAESMKAYDSWLKGMTKDELSEYLETSAKEDRFARRSKAGKEASATKKRKADAEAEMAKDPAGKMVQEIKKKRDSLMKRWEYTSDKLETKRIDEEMDRTEEPFRIAQKHWRLRQAHGRKDTQPHEIRRNNDLPELGSSENKQETKGERQDSLIPWSVGFTGGNGERRIIVAGASLHDSEVGKGTACVQLKDANGKDGIRDGLLIHFDRGDQEKNKRARQLVWAINNGKAEDVSFEKLQEFVMGDSIDHHHSDYKKTPRGVADAKTGPKAPRGFSFAQHVKLAADSIDKLRKSDVFRLVEQSPSTQAAKFVAEEIGRQRPDLKSEADQSIYDFLQDADSSKYAAADRFADRFIAEAMGLIVEQYEFKKKDSEVTTGKHGDRGRYVTTDNGSQIFLTSDGEIGQTGKNIGGDAGGGSSNQPASDPQSLPGGDSATGPQYKSPFAQTFAQSILANIRKYEESQRNPQPAGPDPKSHPHHHSKLPPKLQHSLLTWSADIHRIAQPIGWARQGAEASGEDARGVMKSTFGEINKADLMGAFQKLDGLIAAGQQEGVDIRPFVKHNNLIPRTIAAKLKPSDLFHPVRDEERYAARQVKSSPGQLGLWDDNATGSNLLRTSARQKSFDWDESKVKRDPEGKFAEQSGGASRPAIGKNEHGADVITQGHIGGGGDDGTFDRLHAGLASEIVQSKIAIGMKGIEGREYAILQHNGGRWQLVSRPGKKTEPEKVKPAGDEEELKIAGMTIDQAAELASRHGHSKEEAKRKIAARPIAWAQAVKQWADGEQQQKKQERKEKSASSWKPNEKQQAVLDMIGNGRTFRKSQDALSYSQHKKSMESLVARGVIDRTEGSNEVMYSLPPGARPTKASPPAAVSKPKKPAASKNKPQDFNFDQHVKIAADSIDKLRKSEVSRLIESTPDAKTAQFVADEIGKQRPDLKSEADESIYDYMQEVSMKYAASRADAIVDRFMAEAMGISIEQYAARKVKSSPGQQEFDWITVHPNGAGTKGVPVMIDRKDGTIKAGMGGKFDGQKIGEIGGKGGGGEAAAKPAEGKSEAAARPAERKPPVASGETGKSIAAMVRLEERMKKRSANAYDVDQAFKHRKLLFDNGWTSDDIEREVGKRIKLDPEVGSDPIEAAIIANGGHEANSANDVDAIHNSLYRRGEKTPSHADIRAVMERMKNAAGEKPTAPGAADLQARDRFTDSTGQEYEVFKSRFGTVVAHPVIDGKPQVNRDSGETFAIDESARSRNPGHRTDIKSVSKWQNPDAKGAGESAKPEPSPVHPFAQSAMKGKIREASGQKLSGEESSSSWYETGKINNYSDEDIQKFYLGRAIQTAGKLTAKDFEKGFDSAINSAVSRGDVTDKIASAASAAFDRGKQQAGSKPKPATAPSSFVPEMIPGQQASLFGGDDLNTGQKSLFNMVRPTKADQRAAKRDAGPAPASLLEQIDDEQKKVADSRKSLPGQRDLLAGDGGGETATMGGEKQFRPIAEIRTAMKGRLDQAEAKFNALEKSLISQKSKSKSKSVRDGLDNQYREAKDAAQEERQRIIREYQPQLMDPNHPEVKAQREKDRAYLESRRSQENQRAAEGEGEAKRETIAKINSQGGFATVIQDLEKELSQLQGRLKRTGDTNKWKLDSNVKNLERQIASVKALQDEKPSQFSTDQVDRFIERYRAGSSAKKADTKPKTVTGSKGDRGRFITVGEGDAAHPVFLPGSVKKIKETGEYRTDNSRAKAKEARKKNKAAGGGAGKFIPVTKIEKSIVDTVGDHPDDVREFRSIVDKTYSEMANEARDKIAAIREITAMAGYDRSNAGGFIRSIRAARDYDKIPRFDQMADYAKRAFPGVLAPKMAEAGGSHEQALFDLLKDGIPEMPDKHSREVMDESWSRSGYDQTGKPSEWAADASSQDEDDFVPFSASLAARMSIERYRANPRAVGAPQFMRSR